MDWDYSHSPATIFYIELFWVEPPLAQAKYQAMAVADLRGNDVVSYPDGLGDNASSAFGFSSSWRDI